MSLMFHLTPKNDLKKKAINHGLHLNNYQSSYNSINGTTFIFYFINKLLSCFALLSINTIHLFQS